MNLITLQNEIADDESSVANFKLDKIDSMYVPGPKFLSYHYWGAATPLK